MVCLTINDMPICGVVGENGSIVIAYQDCWDIYNRRFKADGPVTALKGQWRIDGQLITPKAWFLEIAA